MNYILILFIVVLLLYINQTSLESFLQPFKEFIAQYIKFAPYPNLCLTDKPYGFSDPKYDYWKDRISNMKKEYAHCHNRGCPSKVPVKPIESGTSFSAAVSDLGESQPYTVESKYYDNPAKYCHENPDKYPCPNYFTHKRSYISDPALINEGDRQGRKIAKTYCKVNNKHELASCGVNDNDRMLIIYPDREDNALC
jgi:hypothetical protein